MSPETASLLNFFAAMAGLIILGLAVWLGNRRDERRWREQREAEAASKAAE